MLKLKESSVLQTIIDNNIDLSNRRIVFLTKRDTLISLCFCIEYICKKELYDFTTKYNSYDNVIEFYFGNGTYIWIKEGTLINIRGFSYHECYIEEGLDDNIYNNAEARMYYDYDNKKEPKLSKFYW